MLSIGGTGSASSRDVAQATRARADAPQIQILIILPFLGRRFS
jgi:hypothetical protein